jgi:hypothetical protein
MRISEDFSRFRRRCQFTSNSIPSHKLSTVYPCVAKLGSSRSLAFPVVPLTPQLSVPHLSARPIPTPEVLYSAFNSISVQTIRDTALLPQRHDNFWSIQSDSADQSIGNKWYPETERTILERGKQRQERGREGERECAKEKMREDVEIMTESK